MNRITSALRRLRRQRPQLIHDLEFDITWADIMNDLDPYWSAPNSDTRTHSGGQG